jgi:hypothetical protein
MWVLPGGELGLEQAAHDIDLQGQEQERVHREHAAEQAHGQRVYGYSPISAVGNGMNAWPIRKIELSHTRA